MLIYLLEFIKLTEVDFSHNPFLAADQTHLRGLAVRIIQEQEDRRNKTDTQAWVS